MKTLSIDNYPCISKLNIAIRTYISLGIQVFLGKVIVSQDLPDLIKYCVSN